MFRTDKFHRLILAELERIVTGLTDLQTAVATESTLIAQLIAYAQGEPARQAAAIAAAEAGDAATLEALKAQVASDTAALAAAFPSPPAPPAS